MTVNYNYYSANFFKYFNEVPTDRDTSDARIRNIKKLVGGIKDRISKLIFDDKISESEKNKTFLDLKPYLTPAGYFSAALLAAGLDPRKTVEVDYQKYWIIGKNSGSLSSSSQAKYALWEIAAGQIEHDKSGSFWSAFQRETVVVKSAEDQEYIIAVNELMPHIQYGWTDSILKLATASSFWSGVAKRAGLVDVTTVWILVKAMSVSDDFKKLSSGGRNAITRTLDANGQIIIPNVYGYPLSGYAFLPYSRFSINGEGRPNQGLMVDLRIGKITEINGDDEFAIWAKENQALITFSFNAWDNQPHHDTHWPQAAEVLENLIKGSGTYPGYAGLISDKAFPSRQLFNYTISRDPTYSLKFADINQSAPLFQAQFVNNAIWKNQTEVFGKTAQGWKWAKNLVLDFSLFVPIPGVGLAANLIIHTFSLIPFAINDWANGATAADRQGGQVMFGLGVMNLAHGVVDPIVNLNFISKPTNKIIVHSLAAKRTTSLKEYHFISHERDVFMSAITPVGGGTSSIEVAEKPKGAVGLDKITEFGYFGID